MDFVIKKGAIAVKETILEAQQLALEKHCVEFKTNLWIGKLSFPFIQNGYTFCWPGKNIGLVHSITGDELTPDAFQ